MKRGRFKEEQIIGVLKEGARGCGRPRIWARTHCVSGSTLYSWKANFGSMDVSEVKRLKQLEDENAKLKKLLAEQMLDAKRGAVAHLQAVMGLSERGRPSLSRRSPMPASFWIFVRYQLACGTVCRFAHGDIDHTFLPLVQVRRAFGCSHIISALFPHFLHETIVS